MLGIFATTRLKLKNNKLISILVVIAVLIVGIITWFVFSYNPALNHGSISKNSPSTSTSTQSPLWGEYHVNAPNALMLVDSRGRRTGKDPVTGILYREIPGTSLWSARPDILWQHSERLNDCLCAKL